MQCHQYRSCLQAIAAGRHGLLKLPTGVANEDACTPSLPRKHAPPEQLPSYHALATKAFAIGLNTRVLAGEVARKHHRALSQLQGIGGHLVRHGCCSTEAGEGGYF